jgi:type I restriction enzyme S subunit
MKNYWIKTKLKDLVKYEKGKKPKNQKESKTTEYKYPYIDIEAFEKGIYKSYTDGIKCTFCSEKDFLMVWDGSRSGYVGKGVSGALGSTLMRIQFPEIENNYAYYFLKGKYLEINTKPKGTGTPHVDPDLLWNYEFPLPPLPEQRAIVTKIEALFSRLDNGIENLKKVREQLKIYRQAVLKKAFEGELTKEWRAQQKDLPTADELLNQIEAEREAWYENQLKEWGNEVKKWEKSGKKGKKPGKPRMLGNYTPLTLTDLKSLPLDVNNSTWIRLGEISFGVEYGTSAKSKKIGKVSVLRMGNIQNHRFEWNDLVYTDDENEINKYILSCDDVLFNRTNSPELVGKTAVYKGEKKAIFAGYLIRINQIKTLANANYINYYLNSHIAKVHGNIVKTDGVNQSNINGEKLSNYPFPFCSLPEQNQIVKEIETRLSVCDNIEANIDEALTKAEALRQSILKKAFEGRLLSETELEKVRAEPDWEPAEKLLERISLEKRRVG